MVKEEDFEKWQKLTNENIETAIKLLKENVELKKSINKLNKCYCNRTDCSGRIKDSKKHDSLQQKIDIAISKIDEVFAEEDWYVNYEYNDLEDVLKEVKKILQGADNNE